MRLLLQVSSSQMMNFTHVKIQCRVQKMEEIAHGRTIGEEQMKSVQRSNCIRMTQSLMTFNKAVLGTVTTWRSWQQWLNGLILSGPTS